MNMLINIKILLLVFIVLNTVANSEYTNDHCPCSDAALEPQVGKAINITTSTPAPALCVYFESKLVQDKELFVLISEALEILTNANETMPLDLHILRDPLSGDSSTSENNVRNEAGVRCHVLLRVVSSTQYEDTRGNRELCPGTCFPVPEILTPITWLLAPTLPPQLLRNSNKSIQGGAVSKEERPTGAAQREDAYLTCSLGLQQYLRSSHISHHGSTGHGHTAAAPLTSVTYLLMTLFWRRLMECREQKHWRQSFADFSVRLEEYFAVERQFATAHLRPDSHNRRLQQPTGTSLGQWEDQLKRHHKGHTGKGKKGDAHPGAFKNHEDGSVGAANNARRHRARNNGNANVNENGNDSDGGSKVVISGRRRIEALVIWVGSEQTHELMQEQSRMLMGSSLVGHSAVVGWAADDRLYGCAEKATQCDRFNSNHRFKYLPASAIKHMPVGWGCAQRRPLRALAHTLLLYDPTYVVVVDDDTFLNFPMLVQRLGKYLTEDMSRQPIVLGEFMGRTGPDGHVSRKGLYAGGSGYILGRSILSQLVAPEAWAMGGLGVVNGPTIDSLNSDHGFTGDAHRSAPQMEKLSVLADAVLQSTGKCSAEGEGITKNLTFGEASTRDSCIISLVPRRRHENMRGRGGTATLKRTTIDVSTLDLKQWQWPSSSLLKESLNSAPYAFESMVVPIGTRLVDMCATLMSNEATCQHSDHAMGRCLMYGASGIPVGVTCYTQVPLATVPSVDPLTGEPVLIGMCFMTEECDLDTMLTCHRYKPSKSSAYSKTKNGNEGETKGINHSDSLVNIQKGKELAFHLAGKPSKLHSKTSYYKVYSSFWNGTHSDTNNLY